METPQFDAQTRKNLVQRVSDILLRPQPTWEQIDAEDGNPARIYLSYLIFLAAIPAIAGFIGTSLVGVGGFGITLRVPIVAGLVNMVVGYALSLAMVYVMAMIANALAPRYQGQQNMGGALKLIAYGATAGMLGGVFSIIPALSMLGVLGGLYSIYLIYLGVPVVMKVPKERATGYTVVLILCGVVAALVMGAVMHFVAPGARSGSGGLEKTGAATIQIPGTDIKIDTARMEEAARKLEQAQGSGAPDAAKADAAAQAATEMLGAVLGGKGQTAFTVQQLRAVVPERLAGLERQSIKAKSEQVMGITIAQVAAEFRDGEKFYEVNIQDLGAAPALVMGMASWAHTESESEDGHEISRSYKQGKTAVRESYRKDGSRADLSMLLPNQVVVQVVGSGSMDQLKQHVAPMLREVGELQRAS